MFAALLNFVVLVIATDALPAPGSAAPSGWQVLYQAPVPGEWFTSVWLRRDGSWRAAGKDLIVSGTETGIRKTDVTGFIVYSFGEDADGAVIAVGSRQAIWEEHDNVFKRVHERSGTPLHGRAANRDILEGVGYVDPHRPNRLVAFGSLHLVVSREGNQHWQLDDDERLARRGSMGPEPKPPQGCHPAGWFWLGRTDGIMSCHEGAVFVYAGPKPALLNDLPRPCATSMSAAVRDGNDVFVACGATARIWRRPLDRPGWSEIPSISGVRALQARGGCLLVATGSQVLRRCGDK